MTKQLEDDRAPPSGSLPDLDMAQIEKTFLADLDGAEAGYLASMGIRIGDGAEESDQGDEDSLYEAVCELNRGLKASVAATLALFRKIVLKLGQGAREPDKRARKVTQSPALTHPSPAGAHRRRNKRASSAAMAADRPLARERVSRPALEMRDLAAAAGPRLAVRERSS
jgi:hypothetical protein